MNHKIFCIAIVLFLHDFVAAQSTADQILKIFLQQDALKNAHVGINFVNMQDGKVIMEHQSKKSFNPASTLKISTTAAALLNLGIDFRYQTKVFLEGKLEGDQWNGNLIIVGSGDPGLGSGIAEYTELKNIFNDLVSTLKQNGIKSIKGSIIIDPSILPYYEVVHDNISGGVIWEDIGNYYATGMYGFNFNQNKFDITFQQNETKGALQSLLKIEPIGFEQEITHFVKTGDPGSGDQTYVSPSKFDGSYLVQGTLPPGKGEYVVKGSIINPPKEFLKLFAQNLSQQGIQCDSFLVKSRYPIMNVNPLFTIFSPSLAAITKEVNEKSNNLFAEGLLRAIAIKLKGKGDLATARKAISEFWKNEGISLDGCELADGSGLSRSNYVTPEFLTQILRHTLGKDNSETFLKSLSIAGKTGTLKTFCANNDLKNNLKGKSGSMSKVLAYTGVFNNLKGEKICFTVIVNNADAKPGALKILIENLLSEVYRI